VISHIRSSVPWIVCGPYGGSSLQKLTGSSTSLCGEAGTPINEGSELYGGNRSAEAHVYATRK
jgi:hypothetical protein